MSSLPSHFVPDQPGRLTKRSFQSPYSYRASGLAQIAVSALLRANSIGARDILAAEHCRYGTRDFSPIQIHSLRGCVHEYSGSYSGMVNACWMPPSSGNTEAVMNPESLLARNATVPASS